MKIIWHSLIALMVILGALMISRGSKKIEVVDALEGFGPAAHNGQVVIFDYQAYVYNKNRPDEYGQLFDSTYSRKEPRKLVLGAQQTIPGLEKALIGMKAGGRRHVVIPGSQGYGKKGAGGGLVPPQADLLYMIELRKISQL